MKNISTIYTEVQKIKQQVQSAKDSAKDIYLLKSNLAMVEIHIENSLLRLNHLLQDINDYKKSA